MLCRYDVILLSESWTSKISNIDIDGYQSHVVNRRKTKSGARRSAGGIVVYIKEVLCRVITVLKRGPNDSIWLKYENSVGSDIIFCACYIPPMNSAGFTNADTDLFDSLVSDLATFKEKYGNVNFVISGDLNGRTGTLPDYIIADDMVYTPVPDDYCCDTETIIPRCNEDHVVNIQGKRVLELCKMCNLRIANGRLGADISRGQVTCVTYNGKSLVDYVLCTPVLMNDICYFQVMNQNQFSDHSPILYKINVTLPVVVEEAPQKFSKMRWDPLKRDDFIQALHNECVNAKLQESVSILSDETVDPCDKVKISVTSIVDALRLAGDDYFLVNMKPTKSRQNKRHPEWADREWLERKRYFYRMLDKYKRNDTDSNRLNMIEARKRYKRLCNQRRNEFESEQTRKLLNAKVNNVRQYWRMLAGPKSNNTACMITNNEYKDYFMRLGDPGDEFFTPDDDVLNRLNQLITSDMTMAFEELNIPLTHRELEDAIKQLKGGKSGGEDLTINEFFVHGKDILMPYILRVFNYIFDCGIFPESWSEGLLVPLHKKGDINIVDNYRGITLLSIFGKLFTRMLNNQLNSWAERYAVYVEAQNGFRPKRGTVDSIFILHNIINKCTEEGRALYTFFVDFSKAFDFVVHDNLWFKLLSIRINGKMINIIRSMYNCIKTKVFTGGIISDVFYSTLGVRQGECLSPFLFSMYINDMESYLASPNAGITIGHIRLLLLLYADDVVIFANSPQELQTEMHKLFLYCEKWKLKLNTTKSKVVIFKRRAPNVAHRWVFGGAEISTTDAISYLGVMFSSSGSFTQAQCKLAEQAHKAVFLLYRRINRFRNMKISEILGLFDKIVLPILLYGCEVWGFHRAPEIERVHLKFC